MRIMEVCGTHTTNIARSGLRTMLAEQVELISGPGCPVCVTDQSYIDCVVRLARNRPDVVIATYGDMVRVPGRLGSLAEARAVGANVQVVQAADQAVEMAKRRPKDQVVFLGVGFETTAPGTAMAVRRARGEAVGNFSILMAHKLILPAMHALLSAGDVRIDGFLCPGHVSVIIGWQAYEPIAREYGRPCVVAGFDPPQILAGIAAILAQLHQRRPAACTVYDSVSPQGSPVACRLLDEVFTPADATWRGLGAIADSGLRLRPELAYLDAATRFELVETEGSELPGCRCGDVICGRCRPTDCALFAAGCSPRDAHGPCMVSSEGACAAAFKYEQRSTGP